MKEKDTTSLTLFDRLVHENNEILAKELLALQENPFTNQQDRCFGLLVLITNIFVEWVDALPRKEKKLQENKFKKEARLFSSGTKLLEQFIASKILNRLISEEITG